MNKWKICVVWKHPFCDHRTTLFTHNECFINQCINLHFLPSITRECHLEMFDFSNCCCEVRLSFNIHRLEFLQRHNITVFLALIFIHAWSHATKRRSSACSQYRSEDASSAKSSEKWKRSILQFSRGTPSSTGC